MDLVTLHHDLRRCTHCQAAGFPVQGPPIFAGEAGARWMVVGQAPGQIDVTSTFLPFSGAAGTRLFGWLRLAGWEEQDFRRQCYFTSITKCFPGPHPSGRGDRVPSRTEQRLCSDWLDAEVTLVDPAVILPIGSLAIERFFGPGYRLVDIVGQRFQLDGRIVVPLPHPSGASAWTQLPDNKRRIDQAIAHLSEIKREQRL